MKSTWTILNEVINNKKSKSNLPTTFNVDDKEISDPTQIVDHFCAYFTNIGPNLANSIPPCLTSHRSFLSGAFMNLLYLQPTTEQEIIDICASFRAGTASDYDQITMSVIKEIIDLIVQPLMYITNLSLSSGSVPDQMKIARVVPLFKTGDLSLLTNYRPVSVLPTFSKIPERIVYNHLINFLNKINLTSFLVISMVLGKITQLPMH